jgi:hypothetical protein
MHLLPVLLIVGLIGLLAAPVLVLMSRPGGARSPLDLLSRRNSGPPKPRKPKTPRKPKLPPPGDTP